MIDPDLLQLIALVLFSCLTGYFASKFLRPFGYGVSGFALGFFFNVLGLGVAAFIAEYKKKNDQRSSG